MTSVDVLQIAVGQISPQDLYTNYHLIEKTPTGGEHVILVLIVLLQFIAIYCIWGTTNAVTCHIIFGSMRFYSQFLVLLPSNIVREEMC